MRRILYAFFLSVILASSCLSQPNVSTELQNGVHWQKYLIKQFSGSKLRAISNRAPYVFSTTVSLSLNSKGEILKVDFIEKSTDSGFNDFIKDLVMTTSGLWKVSNMSTVAEELKVIIPIVHFVKFNDESRQQSGLLNEYQTYHKNLSQVENCENKNCIVLDELVNSSGSRIR